MKETEEAAISEGIRLLAYTLDADEDVNNTQIKLEPGTRTAYYEALQGLEDIFDQHEDKMRTRANRLAQLRTASKNLDIQQTFWDEKGRARNLDDNGKLIPVPRRDKAFEAAASEPDGIDPRDGIQGTLGNSAPHGWKIPSGVPPVVERGLVQALQDGAGRTKACGEVAEKCSLTKAVVEVHFDALVKRGIIAKVGKNWVAEVAEGTSQPDSDDPDVIATSETPGRGLISATEPAEAKVA